MRGALALGKGASEYLNGINGRMSRLPRQAVLAGSHTLFLFEALDKMTAGGKAAGERDIRDGSIRRQQHTLGGVYSRGVDVFTEAFSHYKLELP